MPYYITDKAEGCADWAVVKENGEVLACHPTKKSAIDQMVAVSIAEGMEPGGTYTEQNRDSAEQLETRAAVGTVQIGDYVSFNDKKAVKHGEVQDIVINGSIAIQGSAVQLNGSTQDPVVLVQVYEEITGGWQETSEFVAKHMSALLLTEPLIKVVPDELTDPTVTSLDVVDQSRAVNLTPPAYMRAAARQGLRYYEEGKGGDGLVDATIREARAMAQGNVTADKWVRIRAWIARHLVDLDSPSARPDSPDYPSAGVVAHLLWGSGPSKRSAERALAYAEGVVARLEAENRGRAKGEALSKIETRVFTNEFEVRQETDGMHLTGYAARFNEPSEPLPFIERIAPGAFKRSLRSRNDIKLLWNHDSSKVLGSTRAGTLTLTEDAVGLRVSAILPNNSWGNDAKVSIQRGDVTGFSFGFTVPTGGDSWSTDGSERTLKSVRLHEVSTGVAFPAYSSTNGTAQVRGLDMVAERSGVDADLLADALLKIEDGQEISSEEAEMLSRVVADLSPAPEAVVVEEPAGDVAMLALKKKKLELLMKGL